jgi:hypothetical protein
MSAKRRKCHIIMENIYYIPVNTTLWDAKKYGMCHVIVHVDSEMAVVQRSVMTYLTVISYRERGLLEINGSLSCVTINVLLLSGSLYRWNPMTESGLHVSWALQRGQTRHPCWYKYYIRFWILSIVIYRPVYFSKHVSEIGLCLRLQVKPTQLCPIYRASPYLRTPVPAPR